MDEAFWQEVRKAFPATEALVYLNGGTQGPLPLAARNAMVASLERDLLSGRAMPKDHRAVLHSREKLRASLARLIESAPEDICLARSTTEGVNIVFQGLNLRPEDEVVTSDLEFPAVLRAIKATPAKVRVVALSNCPDDESINRTLSKAISPRCKLLVLSDIAYETGRRLPIEAIARLGPPLLVDAAQSVGALPLKVTEIGCSFLAFPGHKWLAGPVGAGALYLHPEWQETLHIAFPSALGQSNPMNADPDPRAGAGRFDPGPLDPILLAGLQASLDYAEGLGTERFDRVAALACEFRKRLAPLVDLVPSEPSRHVITFTPRYDANALAAKLHGRGIAVRAVSNGARIRISLGYWNNADDCDALLFALAECAGTK
jgi:L-cysteine/cystine lyase